MQFTFTKTYPDEIPLIEVARSDGIEENDEQDLLNHLREEVFLSNVDIILCIWNSLIIIHCRS